jgi:hypothetical protein
MNWAPIPPLPADVPAPVAALVMKALAHDPARRFQSAREMRDALDAAMVRCNLTTTPAHVAGFVSEHLRALSDARKRTIEQALSQATVRRASERPPSTLPYGGAMASSMPPPNTLRGVGGGGAAGSVAPPAPPIPTIALFGPAPPGVPLVGGAATNAAAQPIAPPPPAATAAHDAPAHLTQSQVSQMNGTLARAATTSSTFDERPPFMPPRRSRIVAIGVAAVAAVGLVVAGAIGELGRGGAGAGAAGSLAAHAASTAGETAAANATATAAPAATTATTTAMAGAAAATAPAAAMGGGAVSPAQTAAAMETSGRGHGASSSHHATTRGAAARTTAAAPPAMQTAAPPAPKPASPSGKSGDDDLGF